MHKKLWSEDLKDRDHAEGKIILELMLRKKGWESVKWIHLAQEKDQWQAHVNRIMNIRVP